jgi:hypothetical protein
MNKFNIATSTVKNISQVLKIRPPQVYALDVQDFPNPHVSSMYVSSKDVIVFNSSWIDQVDLMEVVATAIHETRHAYESYCVKYNIYEDENTIQIWKDCFEHYEKPMESLDTKDHIDYLNQPIEIDAISFIYHIILDWFKLKLTISE